MKPLLHNNRSEIEQQSSEAHVSKGFCEDLVAKEPILKDLFQNNEIIVLYLSDKLWSPTLLKLSI